MQTRFNIGDTVLIKGTIRRIEITREGEIYYDVDTEEKMYANMVLVGLRKKMWKNGGEKMLVCIDCGHGLTTKGKQCLDGTKEWVLNSRIGEYVEKMLTERGITVVRSDDRSGKTDVPLITRVRKANEVSDYFISIHHNAGIKGGHGGGIVVFWYSSKPEREKQARALYNRAVRITGLKGNRSNPVVKKSFYVLRKTKCPALLIECGFMDSVRDLPIIKTEDFAWGIAHAITDFVMNDIN